MPRDYKDAEFEEMNFEMLAKQFQSAELEEQIYHIEFDVKGDLSLLMHHLLTLGSAHWKIINGADGVTIQSYKYRKPYSIKKRVDGTDWTEE